MKRILFACIAAFLACGVSARAAEAEGDVQVIITIPVYQGENQIGVSLEPLNNATTLAQMFGIDANATLHTGDSDEVKGSALASRDAAYFYYSSSVEPTVLHAYGLQATETDVAVTPGVLTMLASPQAKAWKLSDVTWTNPDTKNVEPILEQNSYKIPNTKANWVYIWDAELQSYKKYWYDALNKGWRLNGEKDLLEEAPEVKAGQGVYVRLSTLFGSEPVTLTFPQ